MLEPHCQNLCEGDRKSPGQVLEKFQCAYNSIDLHMVTPKWHTSIFPCALIIGNLSCPTCITYARKITLPYKKNYDLSWALHLLKKSICLDIKIFVC